MKLNPQTILANVESIPVPSAARANRIEDPRCPYCRRGIEPRDRIFSSEYCRSCDRTYIRFSRRST